MALDKKAKDFYYRDIIGDITTSHVEHVDDAVNVELTTRFPMMGGWKTEFIWGYFQSLHGITHSYNLPSNRVLKKQGSRYSLTVPFSSPIQYSDIQELTVRIILPECVKNVKYVLPEGVSEPTLDYRYTYLDSSLEGRHVYEFKKTNLVQEQKNEMITVGLSIKEK